MGINICGITCFLMHVKAVLKGSKIKVNYLYFIPITTFAIICLLNYFNIFLLNFSTHQEEFVGLSIINKSYFTDSVFIRSLIILILVIVIFTISIKYKQFQKNKKTKYYLIWLNIYLSILLIAILGTTSFYYGFFDPNFDSLIHNLTKIFILLALLNIALYPSVVYIIPSITKPNISKLDNIDDIYRKVDDLMISEQLFLNKKFAVRIVSERTGLDQKAIISAILNKTQGNWKTYINSLRIDFAIDMIKTDYLKRCSIFSLSEESGFNSHQSFYRAFKTKTGMTPGQFYKNL
tara:strand:+ start:639 stop:1514 length:876 start_codon:yes stop_codon:yes gene_type:complete